MSKPEVSAKELNPPCFLCESGTLRIFCDATDNMKVKIDHSQPACAWWLHSRMLAELMTQPTNE